MIKKRLVQLLSHAKKYIVYQIVWQWLSLFCQVMAVYAAATLLEEAAFGSPERAFVLPRVVMIAAALVLRFVFDRRISHASYMASADVKCILREKIYGKLLRLGASYKENVATSAVVQMSAEGVEQLETYFGKYLPQLFYSLLAPLTLFVLLSRISMKAAVVLLICVPLMPVAIVVVQKIAKKLLAKYWGIYTGLGDSFLENLQGLTTLKIYKADEKKAEEMDAEALRFRTVTMKVLTMQLNSTSIMDIVAYGGAAVGMVIAISEYVHGNISLSGALMIILLAVEFFIPLRLLGSYFHIAMNGMAASDRIFEFLDTPEPEDGKEVLGDEPLDIRMSGVGFSYEEGRETLKNIDISLPDGSFTSLAGQSGCGKSTIASVLMGRNKGYTGSILIGGRELRDVSEASLMEHVTLVAHDSYIFKGTLRDNLLMGKPDADDEELKEALRKVNLLGFTEAAGGLDAEVLERGSNLSGGQCQRLALARALLRDTPVYIFDEATSNIDAGSEAVIMRAVHELARTRTVLLISHRLANVVSSDKIYMMKDGAVCESGTHAELMEKDGEYSRLYRYQKELEAYAGEEDLSAAETAWTSQAAGPERSDAAAAAEESKKRRPGAVIMGQLIVLIKPLLPVMLLAVVLGVIGYMCAISLTILAGHGLVQTLPSYTGRLALAGAALGAVLIISAVARGFLHYGEQYCNHFIAFKLLAIIRHKVFAALRRLCPAKLEGKDRGNLISIITSDIELLEVFYAHTISPIAIAVIISVLMTVFIGGRYAPAAIIAAAAYIVVGIIIPLWNGRQSAEPGMKFRDGMGDLNSFVLESMRGLGETIQYGRGQERLQEMTDRSHSLGSLQKKLNRCEMAQRSVTNLVIGLFSYGMLFFMLSAFISGSTSFNNAVIAAIAMMGSFGPVAALSSLSNNLNQTLASGERVLQLLEEPAQVEEVTDKKPVSFDGAKAEHVSFAYGNEMILKDYSIDIEKDKIIGIHGASGSGKSTLLKLLMRFWDVQEGRIEISGRNIKNINTSDLRDMQSYVTQETYIFHDTIANNIAIGRMGADREEIVEAARKAAIDDFIQTLPDGYDTKAGELGDTLSGGERQRIGVARAFLHDAPFMLLDEPTSNLDSLNEGIILRSLTEAADKKTIVLVSHRRSTMNIADKIVEMPEQRTAGLSAQ